MADVVNLLNSYVAAYQRTPGGEEVVSVLNSAVEEIKFLRAKLGENAMVIANIDDQLFWDTDEKVKLGNISNIIKKHYNEEDK